MGKKVGTKEEYLEATRDLAAEVKEGVTEAPIDKQTGKVHKGYENLRPFKKGENFHGGQKKGYKTPKTKLKEHLKMLRSVLQTASKNLKLNYSIQRKTFSIKLC